jgi:hypothetical protein
MRKPLFISTPNWWTIPFRQIPQTPVQQVMTIGSSIATALEKLDNLNEKSTCAQIRTIASLLETIHSRLDNWHAWFTSHSPNSLPFTKCSSGQTTLHFLDTAAANGLTHYWAFSLICFTYLHQLANVCPSINNRRTDADKDKGEGSSRKVTAQQYATWILQSTTYLTQDDQKLFGATSLAVPFKVGFGYLQRYGGVHGREICDVAIRRLGLKGYHYLVKFTHRSLASLGPLLLAHHQHE